MKGRIPGALFVICLFAFGLLFDGGIFFIPILFAALLIADAEVYLSYEFYRLGAHEGKPKYEAAVFIEMIVILFALFACFMIDDYRYAVLAVGACFISDTAGYCIGNLFGKNNKVSALKEISPNKSFAGFVGSILLAAPLTFLLAKFLGVLAPENACEIIIFCSLSGITAAAGDLLGSATKRAIGIKDSGEDLAKIPYIGYIEKPLLASQGGYLDRLDSIAPEILLAYLILQDFASH